MGELSGVRSKKRFARSRRTYELARTFAVRELRLRYRQSLLTVAWALISPIAILTVYGLILTQGFKVTVTCGPYLSSAWLGLVFWTYFASSLSSATTSLVSSANILTKLSLPLEALPLGAVGASLADLGVGLVTLFAALVIQGVPFGRSAVGIVLPLAILVVWTSAISIVSGVLAAFARDVVHAVALILRIGFFATPVMYEANLLPSAFAWSATTNPIAVAITGARNALLCGTSPDLSLGGIHLALGVLALIGSVAYTRAVEQRIPDVI